MCVTYIHVHAHICAHVCFLLYSFAVFLLKNTVCTKDYSEDYLNNYAKNIIYIIILLNNCIIIP